MQVLLALNLVATALVVPVAGMAAAATADVVDFAAGLLLSLLLSLLLALILRKSAATGSTAQCPCQPVRAAGGAARTTLTVRGAAP